MLSKEDYQKIFNSFNNKKVLIIGDVMLDSYLWGKVERISPEAPVPVVAVTKRTERLGGAANVALNIKALGAEPILCSVIGDDNKADIFIDLLKKSNLSCKGIIKNNERKTTTKFRIIGNNAQMLRVDEEDDKYLNKKGCEEFISLINNILIDDNIDVIIFQDYDKGIINKDVIDFVTSKAKEMNIPVAVDPKKRNFYAYRNLDFFKPNFKEFSEGLKEDFDKKDIERLNGLAKEFQQKQNIKTLMVTLSEDGVFIKSDKNDGVLIPARQRSIADVSGAGDTVISIVALCLVLKLLPVDIAFISNIAGGLVCEHVGVVPIDKQRLIDEIYKLLK